MIMAAAALLQQNPHPSEEEIRHGLEGNVCRCTGYHNIVKAVQAAAGRRERRSERPVGCRADSDERWESSAATSDRQ